MADKNDPVGYAKHVRNLRFTENLLRQFLKTEVGLGKNAQYLRGHDFVFSFSEEQKAEVNRLMSGGSTFEEAFDIVKKDEK